MERAEVRVQDIHGFHLALSARVVRCAQRFKSRIVLSHMRKEADACSILQLISLGAKFGSTVGIIATGPYEKEALESIAEVFSDGGGI